MKKVFAFLLATMLLLSLCACGNKKNNSEEENTETVYLLTGRTEYSAEGEILSSIRFQYNGSGLMTELSWDNSDSAASESTESWFERSYIYDEQGSITTIKYSNYGGMQEEKVVYRCSYDDNGYLTRYSIKDWQRISLGEFTLSYSDGKLSKVTDTTGQQYPAFQCEYDSQGHLVKDVYFGGGSAAEISTYSYEDDYLTSIIYSTEMVYVNEQGELATYSSYGPQDSRIHRFAYDGDGHLIQWAVTDISYPIGATGGVEEIVLQRTYSYDANGYPVTMETITYSDGQPSGDTVSCTCDEHGNIVKAVRSDGSYVEFTYEARQITAQQKENHKRQLALEYGFWLHTYDAVPMGADGAMRYFYIWRQHTSNPMFAMTYLEFFVNQ